MGKFCFQKAIYRVAQDKKREVTVRKCFMAFKSEERMYWNYVRKQVFSAWFPHLHLSVSSSSLSASCPAVLHLTLPGSLPLRLHHLL